MRSLLVAASQFPPGAPPGRDWLDRLDWLVPGTAATRGLLLADLALIALIAARSRHRALAVVAAVGAAFLGLNMASMLLTDFYLGLASFHVLTALAGIAAAGHARVGGAALLALTLALGVIT
jgi:hypothetical protein